MSSGVRSGTEKVLRFMDKHQWKLLHFAAYTDWPEDTIRVLLKTVQIPNPSNIDLAELANAMAWDMDVLKDTLLAAQDINHQDKHLRTALHIAANRDNYRFVRCLVKLKSVNVDLQDERGWTPMHYAAKQGHGRVVTCLCLKHANTNIKTKDGARTPLHFAAMEGHTHIVRMLYHHGKADITITTNKGRNVVHLAAQNPSNAECLRVCLDFGYFDVNHPDSTGNTALHYAVECGSAEMVELLIKEYNAKVNVQDKTKQTPLHIAAFNGDFDIVQILVEAGADVKMTDEDNVGPLAYAQEEKHSEIIRYLAKVLGVEVVIEEEPDEDDSQSELGSESEFSSADESD